MRQYSASTGSEQAPSGAPAKPNGRGAWPRWRRRGTVSGSGETSMTMEAQPMSAHTSPTTSGASAAHGGQTTYERYLRTEELLALQKAPAERLHADELVFQITHQTFELWWKLTLELLAAATDALHAGDFEDASQGFRGILRATPGLWDAFAAALDHAGVSLVDLYARPRAWPTLYACAEALTDFDEQFHLFRAAHLKLAQRHLGLQSTGTGGMPVAAMERTLHHLLFPALWQARDDLVARVQAGAQAGD